MRLLAIILLGFLWCSLSAQVDPEQIYQAPGRDYVLLSTDTLNSSYPINGIYVPTRLRDSFYFKSDSFCIGIFGDGRPDPCLLLPTGSGASDTMYYWVFQVNGGTNDTIIQGEHINMVAGTNITISGGTDNPTINAVNMFDTCFHTLTQLTDTTAQLTDCNGADRGTVTFSASTSVGAVDSCLQDLIVSNGIGSDTIFLTDCAGANKDTVVFYPPSVNDSYVDSSFVTYNPDSISIWLYRFDTSGLIDSFPIYLPRDSIDRDSQSLDLTGNTLSITRGNSVDLSGYLDDSDTYTDSASVWFNDTVIVFRFDIDHNLIDSFPIRIPKTSFIEHDSDWLEIPTYDVPFSVEDPIFSGSTTSKRVRIGQDSLETNSNLMINGGIFPFETKSSLSTNLWRQRNVSDSTAWDRVQQARQFYMRFVDFTSDESGIYMLFYPDYIGDSVLFSIDGVNEQIGFRQYPNYRIDFNKDSVRALYYPDENGNLNIMPIDSVQRIMADWDFVHLQDGDTSYYSSNQRDSLLPLDTSSLDSLLWRPGIVRLGDTMYAKIAYDTGGFSGTFRRQYKPQFQIANKINALDIYHWYYPYVWIRNDKADFWIRNHNNDNTVDTLPSFLEIGAESWYDSTGTEFTSDTSNRRILRISSQSNPGAFEIYRGSIKLGDYTPDDLDTTISSTDLLAVYTPKSDGTIALTSLDTFNAALNIAASTPNITLFDRYNTGDSIALNLNATPDTAFADLSWLKTTISNDTLFQGDDFYVLPQGADSLGTSGNADEVVFRTGGRGGDSDAELTYNSTTNSLFLGNQIYTGTTASTGAVYLHAGYNRTGNGSSGLTMYGVPGTSNSASIVRQGGTNGAYFFFNTGTGQMIFQQSNAGQISFKTSAVQKMLINTDGQIKFDAYGSGTFTGTPSYFPALNSTGDFIERTAAELLSDIGAQPAGSYDNYSSWTAGSSSGTRVVTSGSQLDFFGEDSPDISTRISGSSVLFSIPNNAIQTEEITNGTILPADLNATGAADEYILTYEVTGGVFEWANPTSILSSTIDIAVNNSVQANEVHEIDFRSTNGDITWSVTGTGEVDIDIPSNAIQNSEIQNATIVASTKLSATGTPNSSTYLRGDNTWASISTLGGIYGGSNNVPDGTTATLNGTFSIDDNGFSNILTFTSSGSGTMTVNVDPDMGANGGNQLHVGTASTYVQIGHEDNMTPDASDETYIRFYDNATLSQRMDLVNTAGVIRFTVPDHIETAGKMSIGATSVGALTDNLEVTGSAAKTGGGSWSTLSDRRLKKNIKSIEDPYRKVLALNPVTFEYKTDYLKTMNVKDRRYFGYIAQEYENVFPEEVTKTKIATGEENLSITTDGALTYTTAAVQQLIKDNEQQAAQIKVLTEQINKLYDIVNDLKK